MAGYGYGYFQGGVPIGSNVNQSLFFTVAENQTAVGTIAEADATFEITAGAASFNINAATGVITFKTAPNFEAMAIYSLTVLSSKGIRYTITVYVTDVQSAFALNSATALTSSLTL